MKRKIRYISLLLVLVLCLSPLSVGASADEEPDTEPAVWVEPTPTPPPIDPGPDATPGPVESAPPIQEQASGSDLEDLENLIPEDVFTFSSLEELKALIERGEPYMMYRGYDDFVFMEDTVIPEETGVYFGMCAVTIPEGVRVTNLGSIWMGAANVYGTLEIASSGFIQADHLNGAERISSAGLVCYVPTVMDERELQEEVDFVRSFESGRIYAEFHIYAALSLQKALTVPENIVLFLHREVSLYDDLTLQGTAWLYAPLTVWDGVTLTLEHGCLDFREEGAALKVYGTLDNQGQLIVDGALAVEAPVCLWGKYCGHGWIELSHATEEDIPDLLKGVEPDDFFVEPWQSGDVVGLDMKYIGDMTRLAVPTELIWGRERVYLEDVDQWMWFDAPGCISFRNNAPTLNSMLVRLYRVNENEDEEIAWEVFYYEDEYYCWNFFIENELDSGDYYFTVVSRGDFSEYVDSECVRSDIWTYEKPEVSVGECTNLVFDGQSFSFTLPGDELLGMWECQIFYSETEQGVPDCIWSGRYAGEKGQAGGEIWKDSLRQFGEGWYSVRVRALSSDCTRAGNGPWTELSEPVNITEIPREVGDELKNDDPPARVPGDVNGDGKLDGRDIVRLAQHFAGYTVKINEANADVNGDGQLDGRDVVRLAQYFAGYSVTLK